MLYSILRFLFRLTVNGYFRAIYIKGKEHIPKKGAVIFSPNHPSAFMDPILLSTEIDRKLFFLARGDIFQQQVAARLFSIINMIPVYRKGETKGHEEKNDMVFQKCFDHLAKGKPLMIFPEGNSKTERRLRPLKTGVARIALGAEALHEFKLGVKIIPVGINYSEPHTFRSDVFINFGKPIEANEYKSMYLQDEREGSTALTERLKAELEKLLVIVQDERLEKLVSQIEQLYRNKLREAMEPADKGLQDFQLSKDIVQAVDYHIKNNPERVDVFQTNIDAYMNGLKELNIRDTQVRASALNIDVMRSLIYFGVGMPLFLYGYLTNYIPYRLAGIIADLIPLREDFVGSIKITVSMFVFLVLYVVEATVVGVYTNVWWAVLFGVSLYPAGVFSLSYMKRYYQVISTLKYLRLFMRKGDLVAKLKVTRQQLIDELEAGKEEYLLYRN
jgi:glycerol-3-phosphate O-acyltransferase / dihydroxyacetone phosphate acyltransferase